MIEPGTIITEPIEPALFTTNNNQRSGQTSRANSSKSLVGRKWEVGELIGSGAQSRVYEITDIRANNTFACKVTKTNKLASRQEQRNYYERLKIYSELRHPVMSRMIHFVDIDDHKFVFQEWHKDGNL